MKSKFFISICVILILSNGFLLNSCKKDDDSNNNVPPDPCANITCLNGGICVNGICDCPDGYGGPDCGQQITPSIIRISNIVVTKFPATDAGGAGWDLASGADIYVKITFGSTIVWNSPTYYEDANPNGDYNFIPTSFINLTDPNNQYKIYLYDYDGTSGDDLVGVINFTPYNNTNDFPSTITLDNGSVGFELWVSYVWP